MNLLRAILKSVRELFARSTQTERDGLEAYLACSQNLADLEQRERNWNSARDRHLGLIFTSFP
jgi:hypothetical protein